MTSDSAGWTRIQKLETENARLRAESEDLTAAHSLMATQFRTMLREKEHGWEQAERWEGIATAARTESTRLRKVIEAYAAERDRTGAA